ncbi:hypothetical protein C7M84_024225 [Penaeus vannamei]|uniref:C2H2-type domain-containing protein n=1 Tax=Penaeus vannamei TaxID=6689 RepID=A0A3R7MHF0_PENVA|nr:hypothetical protein C7M84_024225 [Penaeus vannamei]
MLIGKKKVTVAFCFDDRWRPGERQRPRRTHDDPHPLPPSPLPPSPPAPLPPSSFHPLHRLSLLHHPPLPTGPNPHHCPYCVYTTVRKSDLVKHVRTHTGERPFSCPDCQHQFTQSSALKTHMRIVHKQDKLYFCEYCHVRFQQRTGACV